LFQAAREPHGAISCKLFGVLRRRARGFKIPCPDHQLNGSPAMRMVLETILLIVLPYGTAIFCGAMTERAGRVVSGWSSIAGLALGIYFFSKSMELLG
jgi:hypothetical protein